MRRHILTRLQQQLQRQSLCLSPKQVRNQVQHRAWVAMGNWIGHDAWVEIENLVWEQVRAQGEDLVMVKVEDQMHVDA